MFRKNTIKAVVIADTHNMLLQTQINELFSCQVDLVIMLGDIGVHDLELLISNEKFCITTKLAVAGNHDAEKMYTNINEKLKKDNLRQINGLSTGSTTVFTQYKPIILFNENKDSLDIAVYIVKDISFAGISGSVKYKNIESPFLKTQKQALEEVRNIPAADIILSHDKPKREFDDSDNIQTHVHYGLYAIWWYMQKYCAANMHGHVHQEYVNGREYSYYGMQYVQIKRQLFSRKIVIKTI